MVLECKVNIGSKVKITELNCTGRVISIWYNSTGLQVEVKYFLDGKLNKEYFFEDEIGVITL
jgi:hypothetical protein